MKTSELMTPLFYGGNFNREGRRMRAILERSVSNGTQTYRLWRTAGKPDVEYPHAENDKYLLHVELNGYIAPLGKTDFALADSCGFEPTAQNLYGGRENRVKRIDSLRESGGYDAVNAALAEERKEIELCGSVPARQVEYIQNFLDEHTDTYLKAKETGGQTFPDFIGALVLNELPRCVEFSAVYKEKCQAKRAVHVARVEVENKAYCETQNKAAEQMVSEAVQIIRDGGVLKNEAVKFYRSRYDASTYSVVNYLMRLYHVEVPLRTQGWINDKLIDATIRGGQCVGLQCFRTKGSQGSQKIWECMNALIQAVTAQAAEKAA